MTIKCFLFFVEMVQDRRTYKRWKYRSDAEYERRGREETWRYRNILQATPPAVVFSSTGVFRNQLCRPIDETLARREEGHDPSFLNLQSHVPKIPTTLECPVVIATDPLSDAIDIDIEGMLATLSRKPV